MLCINALINAFNKCFDTCFQYMLCINATLCYYRIPLRFHRRMPYWDLLIEGHCFRKCHMHAKHFLPENAFPFWPEHAFPIFCLKMLFSNLSENNLFQLDPKMRYSIFDLEMIFSIWPENELIHFWPENGFSILARKWFFPFLDTEWSGSACLIRTHLIFIGFWSNFWSENVFSICT